MNIETKFYSNNWSNLYERRTSCLNYVEEEHGKAVILGPAGDLHGSSLERLQAQHEFCQFLLLHQHLFKFSVQYLAPALVLRDQLLELHVVHRWRLTPAFRKHAILWPFTYPPLTYYWTVLLILDHSYVCRWEINKFENCWYKSVRVLEVLKLSFQRFLNLSSSERDVSGPILGHLSNNRWSGGILKLNCEWEKKKEQCELNVQCLRELTLSDRSRPHGPSYSTSVFDLQVEIRTSVMKRGTELSGESWTKR